MRSQEEACLRGVGDVGVNDCPRGNVSNLTHALGLVFWEQPGVVSLLSHNKGDAWLVVFLKSTAGSLDGTQLLGKNNIKLTLADAITVEDNPLRLPAPVCIVKLPKETHDHGLQVDNLLNGLLSRLQAYLRKFSK